MQINEQEKSPIKQRILQYVDYKGISKYKFYKESGITRGVLDQNTGISEDTLIKFLDYAREISYKWILFGVGEMLYCHNDGEEDENECENNMSAGHRIFSHSDEYGVPLYKEADFFATVRGDYMHPRYANGDIVACKRLSPDTFFFSHRIYLMRTEQGEIVTKVKAGKESGSLIFYSENDEYEPTVVPREKVEGIYIIIGVMKIE